MQPKQRFILKRYGTTTTHTNIATHRKFQHSKGVADFGKIWHEYLTNKCNLLPKF